MESSIVDKRMTQGRSAALTPCLHRAEAMAFRKELNIFNILLFVIGILVLGFLEVIVADQAQESDTAEKLNYLMSKVDTLDSKLDVVDNKLNVLLGVQQETPDDHTKDLGGDQGEETFLDSVLKPAQLIRAERLPLTDGGNRFIISLRSTSNGTIFFQITGDGDQRGPDEVYEEAGGVLSVSFKADRSIHDDVIFFQIVDSQNDYSLVLYLKNIESNNSMSQSLENADIPVLHVNPEREAVYGPDHNVTVTASLVPPDPSAEYLPSVHILLNGVNLLTQEFKQYFEWDQLFEKHELSNSPDKVETSITLDTASQPVGGYLMVSVDCGIAEATIVRTVQVLRTMVVRPSDQTGPFPPGYLTIMDQKYFGESKNGNELRTCRVGKECQVGCFAVGETVSHITVNEVLPDGSMGRVPSKKNPHQMLDTMQSVQWEVQAEPDAGDSDGIITFRCLAIDTRTQRVAEKLIDVQILTPGSIDSERSYAEVESDPEDTNQRRVTLNCAVSGRPLPEVIFYGGTDDILGIGNLSVASDTVYHTGQNEGIAQKVYTISTDELEAIRTGQSVGFSCDIFLDYNEGSESYQFDLSDTDL
ncbi:hypothetical protein RRG08_021767 [Elysia crispata]|uniref:Uncharacterized protein n=1 Tax=Elysia crispata TaxID=231223 RepID=A0AAE0ZZ96_9GAST|nr:hypothetical protein RRG08_021767 [Elysia crispata]